MGKVYLCIPTISRFELLEKCVASAFASNRPPDHVAIMDNSCGELCSLPWVHTYSPSQLTIFTPDHNVGVAGSWNFFMQTYSDIVVIANDDVTFLPNTLELFVGAIEQGGYGLYMGSNAGQNGFSLFSIPQVVFKHTGDFDEEFYPAYFDDNDWHYRLKLDRFDTLCVDNVLYDHSVSSTIHSYTPEKFEVFRKHFIANQNYYLYKWGGLPGHELLSVANAKEAA